MSLYARTQRLTTFITPSQYLLPDSVNNRTIVTSKHLLQLKSARFRARLSIPSVATPSGHAWRSSNSLHFLNVRSVTRLPRVRSAWAVFLFPHSFRGPFPRFGSLTTSLKKNFSFTAAHSNNECNADCKSTVESPTTWYIRYDAYWPLPPTVLGLVPAELADSPAANITTSVDSDLIQEQQQSLTSPSAVTLGPPIASSTAVNSINSTSRALLGAFAPVSVPNTMASPALEDPFLMDLREVAAAAAATRGAAAVPSAIPDNRAAPSVDVTRHNFEVMLPVVKRYLAACDFFSFDCEMTGLFLEGMQENYLDDMQDRYNRTAAAAQSFIITQFGLSCFRRQQPLSNQAGCTPAPRYLAATFNFYIFPRPPEGAASGASRRFMCDAGSLSFLAAQNFDFNRCIYDGVPFMPVRERDEMMRQLDRALSNAGEAPRANVALTKPEDQEFVRQLVTSVQEWLAFDSSEPLELPPVNRYLRLLTYQALARPENFCPPTDGVSNSHPGFFVQKVYDDRNFTRVRLQRCASAAEAAALEAADRARRRVEVAAAAGFAAVWEAMRDCGRPAVGHNCMFDVAYAVAQFGDGRLPATWEGFKRAAASWFRGGLYDTKHICRQLPDLLGSDTTLAVMYGSLVPQSAEHATTDAPASTSSQLPVGISISHARGFEKYVAVTAGASAHEAGYDAFMTGSIIAALEAVISTFPSAEAEASGAGDISSNNGDLSAAPLASVAPYMWRLNVTRSDFPYTVLCPPVPGDPRFVEPVPERPLVFYLGGLSYGVRAWDIHRASEEAGLGKVRITFLSSNSALVEMESKEAAEKLREQLREQQQQEEEEEEKAAGRGNKQVGGWRRLCTEILPYLQYRIRKDEMLAAGTWPLPGHGSGSRVGSAGGGIVLASPSNCATAAVAPPATPTDALASAAADSTSSLRLGMKVSFLPFKRRREEEVQTPNKQQCLHPDGGQGGGPGLSSPGRNCVVM